MSEAGRRALDYLAVGHLTRDCSGASSRLGGTVAYAGLTARALGCCRVGILTSAGPDLDLQEVADALEIHVRPSPRTTTFENLPDEDGRRRQRLLARAEVLRAEDLPGAWREPRIVHFGPIAAEIDPGLVRSFCSPSLRGLTPQGWLRAWDRTGRIRCRPWRRVEPLLGAADAVVVSTEDLGHDPSAAAQMADLCPILVVTAGAGPTRVLSGGRERRFTPPRVRVTDPTGAGDIFAAAFFVYLAASGDPWQAAELANRIAAASTTRSGIASVPPSAEIEAAAGPAATRR